MALQIHQGRAQIEEDTPAEKPCATLGECLVTMALEWSLLHQRLSVHAIDAFFASKSVFERVDSVWSLKIKEPLVTVIVRAKKIMWPISRRSLSKKRGRPKKYGMKIKLMEMFDQSHLFIEKEISIYGKPEKSLSHDRTSFLEADKFHNLFCLCCNFSRTNYSDVQ